jgi:hypothetical protein
MELKLTLSMLKISANHSEFRVKPSLSTCAPNWEHPRRASPSLKEITRMKT